MLIIFGWLLSHILGHEKTPRENFANLDKLDKYYILTKNGLKEMKVNK